MVYSMTGFARTESSNDMGSITLELRTVNHRYLEANVRMPEELRRFELYDQPALQQSFVHTDDANHKTASLILEGITCAACIWLNERHVNALPGVIDFSVNYSTHRARVSWDDSQLHLSDILKAISAIGYVAHPFDPGRQAPGHLSSRTRLPLKPDEDLEFL